VVICYLLFLFVRDDRCSLRRPAATGRPNIIRTCVSAKRSPIVFPVFLRTPNADCPAFPLRR